MQTRRSATHRSYFRISHSAEEAASHHPQMRRIIADVFEPRDVNRLRAPRQGMEKEALVTAAKRSSVLIFPQLLRHFIFLFSSPPTPHSSLTHYTLRNRHDGETCDTNWEPLGVLMLRIPRWFPRQQPPLNALLPIPLSGTFPVATRHTDVRAHAPTQTHGGFSALTIDVCIALQQRKGVFILFTRSNSRSFLFVLFTTVMLSPNTTSHSFQGVFMPSICCARHKEQTQTAAAASQT